MTWLRVFLSVEPFVIGVEGGDGDVDGAHLSDGPMETAELDKYGDKRIYRDYFGVKLDLPFAFEDSINLSEIFI